MKRIVLASGSQWRAQMLANAGLEFEIKPARIDERAVEASLEDSGTSPADLAEVLAIAKADEVSARCTGAYVIGSDQTLSLENAVLHKPADKEEARRRLLALSGKTHELNSAVALVADGEVLWSHVESARITFRNLSPEFVGRHLAAVGEKALGSVGAYQVEGEGVQLMKRIDGDFFTIMGLPLLPLLEELRNRKAIEG